MKPVLVGLSNPYSSNPDFALHVEPKTGSGYRLWKMLQSVDPTVTAEQYLKAFDRRNLTDGKNWSAAGLRKAARKMKFEPGSTVVVLGNDVRLAFGLPDNMLIHPLYDDRLRITWRYVPHPSGLCRFYNNPVQKRLVALLLRDLYSGAGNNVKRRRNTQAAGERPR